MKKNPDEIRKFRQQLQEIQLQLLRKYNADPNFEKEFRADPTKVSKEIFKELNIPFPKEIHNVAIIEVEPHTLYLKIPHRKHHGKSHKLSDKEMDEIMGASWQSYEDWSGWNFFPNSF